MTVKYRISAAQPQAELAFDAFHRWASNDDSTWAQFFRHSNTYIVRFPGLADFIVARDGGSVVCHPAPEVPEHTIAHLYLNQIVPLCLSRQGRLVLHGSAVALSRGAAAAFIGQSGQGKSTLAASFARSGFPFLTDDGLVLDGTAVLPGHAAIRLWDDSRNNLLTAETLGAASAHYTPKQSFVAGGDLPFCDEARPLRRVYLLGDGSSSDVQIADLPSSAVLIDLVRHSFLLDVEAPATLSLHFEQLAALVARPIFFHLDYPRRYDALATVREAVLEHAGLSDDSQ